MRASGIPLCCGIVLALLPVPAAAQGPQLELGHLTALAARAAEVTDVTLDPAMLQLAGGFLSPNQADSAAIRDLLLGLKGLYVKSFRFDRPGVYGQSDVDAIRKQLTAPGWARIVTTRRTSRADSDPAATTDESVEVYLYSPSPGTSPQGLVILAAEPRELTVVNIVGVIDIGKLAALQGQFGIPRMEMEKK